MIFLLYKGIIIRIERGGIMIDSHAHLFADEFVNNLDEVVSRAKEAGVNKIMAVGFSKETNEKALELAKKYPHYFYLTAGIHPSEASSNYELDLNSLEDFLQKHQVYALGECGLDYHYGLETKEYQLALFEKQIILSIKYNLPLIIHSRDAINDTYELLKLYPEAYGVMHCYSGSKEMAEKFLKLGYYIGLGGPVTFKNARVPKEVATMVPLDKLVIETDSPYLAPVPHRGQTNESSYIKYVLAEIASLRQMDSLVLERQLDANTIKLFRLED